MSEIGYASHGSRYSGLVMPSIDTAYEVANVFSSDTMGSFALQQGCERGTLAITQKAGVDCWAIHEPVALLGHVVRKTKYHIIMIDS